MSIDKIQAEASNCNPNQVKILTYMEKNGQLILERVFKELEIPKQTLQYHLSKLERRGLIKKVDVEGVIKPRVLTSFGQRVIKFLNGEKWNEDDALKILTRSILHDIGITDPDESEVELILSQIHQGISELKNKRTERYPDKMVV